MIVKSLTLRNFRNYAEMQLTFPPGLNIIVGANGVGKTNLVEAVSALSLAHSFRTNDDRELVRAGEREALIKAQIDDGERMRDLSIAFSAEGKRIRLDGHSLRRLSELRDVVNVLVFEPKDVLFFNDAPRVRRHYLDIALAKLTGNYLEYSSRYGHLLEERNRILKSEHPDLLQLEVVSTQMAEAAAPIATYRARYIESLNQLLPPLLQRLDGRNQTVEVRYRAFVSPGGDDYPTRALAAFKRAQEGDLRYHATSVGLQREDLEVFYQGMPLANFASQGQKRMVALAIKLAPYYMVETANKRPIVVLDDVLSELDANHRKRLIDLLRDWSQVFITATAYKDTGTSIYEVTDKQEIIRRNFL